MEQYQPFRRLVRLIKVLIKRIKKSNLMHEFQPKLKTMIEVRWEGFYASINSIIHGDNYEKLQRICNTFGRQDLIMRITKQNVELISNSREVVFIEDVKGSSPPSIFKVKALEVHLNSTSVS